jgi:hypothetical protein
MYAYAVRVQGSYACMRVQGPYVCMRMQCVYKDHTYVCVCSACTRTNFTTCMRNKREYACTVCMSTQCVYACVCVCTQALNVCMRVYACVHTHSMCVCVWCAHKNTKKKIKPMRMLLHSKQMWCAHNMFDPHIAALWCM